MKRFACAFLALTLALVFSCSAESIDLSGMSLQELVALREQIQLAMWETDEWQEVEVPQGVYLIGRDIPEGYWEITACDKQDPYIYYGDTLDASGMSIIWTPGIYYAEGLAGTDGWREQNLPGQHVRSVSINLKPDAYLIIKGGAVVFTPYAGAPDLGFKNKVSAKKP